MTVTMVFGYGSLMETESRTRTNPTARFAYPAVVSGFSRGWFHQFFPPGPGLSTTFLGAKAEEGALCNGVIYAVDDIEATDKRESGYHRALIPREQIEILDGSGVPRGDIYIYLSDDESIHRATPELPIVQSYVDICVSGCLEIEQAYRLAGERCFTKLFFERTTDWSEHWVNDRVYPRRPFIGVPDASKIDHLLAKYVGEYFSKVRIE